MYNNSVVRYLDFCTIALWSDIQTGQLESFFPQYPILKATDAALGGVVKVVRLQTAFLKLQPQ